MVDDYYCIPIHEVLQKRDLVFRDLFYSATENFWHPLLANTKIHLDLSKLDFIQHDGAIWLAYIVTYRQDQGYITDITLPQNEAVVGFLKGIGIGSLLDWETTHFRNDAIYNLTPEKYTYSRETERVLAKLIKISGPEISIPLRLLRLHLGDYLNTIPFKKYANSNIGELFKRHYANAVIELIKNITDYGGRSLGTGKGYCSLIPPLRKDNFITYCFADIGKGFKSSLLEYKSEIELGILGKIENDETAIIKGLLFRGSITRENIIGLYPVLGIICATRGSIAIRSGSSVVDISFEKEKNYKSFVSSFFYGYDKKVDEKIGIVSQLTKTTPVWQIPGSQIVIRLGFENIDLEFLSRIDDYLVNRGKQ